jgi:hypothetical protein
MIEDAASIKTTKTAAEWLAEVRQCEREAELFLAYDLSRQGLDTFRTISR